MHIILSETKDMAIETVSTLVLDRIFSHPNSVLGLATGKTMEPVYTLWAQAARQRKIDHSRCFFFMLDDYLGLPLGHPSSFRSYIEERVINPLNLRPDQIAFPPVHHTDLRQAAQEYENLLKESGGIDLQLLGLGVNGHIGFNEPGSHGLSRTRTVALTSETQKANRDSFQGEMPQEAMSMGIGTILESKSLLMLVTGASKAEAVKYLLNHHDDPSCPATFLKSHPQFTLVLDPAAASKINLKI